MIGKWFKTLSQPPPSMVVPPYEIPEYKHEYDEEYNPSHNIARLISLAPQQPFSALLPYLGMPPRHIATVAIHADYLSCCQRHRELCC